MTVMPPTATIVFTSTPQSVAGRPMVPSVAITKGSDPVPSPTAKWREATPTAQSERDAGTTNYILFGGLLAIVVGVMIVILARRRG